MSADGEVEVSVRAEGVDDAAEELADRDGGDGGGDGEGGGGGLSTALAGGIIGGLVSSFLGPILDALNPILQVLEAFLAPVAVLLLRMFQPVLRWLLQLLPEWMRYIRDLLPLAEQIGEDLVNFLQDVIRNLPTMGEVVNAIENFDKIAAEIIGTVSVEVVKWAIGQSVEAATSDAGKEAIARGAGFGRGGRALLDVIDAWLDTRGGGGTSQAAQSITISGGLAPFVETIERSSNVGFLPG